MGLLGEVMSVASQTMAEMGQSDNDGFDIDGFDIVTTPHTVRG